MTHKSKSIITKNSEDDLSKQVARLALNSTAQAAVTITEYNNMDVNRDLYNLHDSLVEQTNTIKDGDMSRCEEMLAAQAHTLDSIFNCLSQKAIKSESMNNLDDYLRLALKAQSQCRTTLDSLPGRKSAPMIGMVQQANIANGPQQVNNVTSPVNGNKEPAESNFSKNKLMEETDGERLDTRTACPASKSDQEMAALGEIHRAEID